MNILSRVLLFLCCVLVFTTLLFYVKFLAERVHNNGLKSLNEGLLIQNDRHTRLIQNETERIIDAEKNTELARTEASELFILASETQAQLERLEAEAALAQRETQTQVNARLEREIQARQKAEKDLERLQTQKETLEEDVLIAWAELETYKSQVGDKLKNENQQFEEDVKKLKEQIQQLNNTLNQTQEKLQQITADKYKLEAEINFIKTNTHNQQNTNPELTTPQDQK